MAKTKRMAKTNNEPLTAPAVAKMLMANDETKDEALTGAVTGLTDVVTAWNPAHGTLVLAVTLEGAAHALGLSRSRIFRLVANGELATVRVGRQRLIATRELQRFLAEHVEVKGA